MLCPVYAEMCIQEENVGCPWPRAFSAPWSLCLSAPREPCRGGGWGGHCVSALPRGQPGRVNLFVGELITPVTLTAWTRQGRSGLTLPVLALALQCGGRQSPEGTWPRSPVPPWQIWGGSRALSAEAPAAELCTVGCVSPQGGRRGGTESQAPSEAAINGFSFLRLNPERPLPQLALPSPDKMPGPCQPRPPQTPGFAWGTSVCSVH